MNKNETLKVLKVLKGYKPAVYKNMGSDELQNISNAWYNTFKDYDAKEVLNATQYCCENVSGILDVAMVKNKIDSLSNPNDNMYLWSCLVKALSNPSTKVFNEMPIECQRFAVDYNGLWQLGQGDINTLHTVTKSLFLREVKAIKEDIAFKTRMESLKLDNKKQEALK